MRRNTATILKPYGTLLVPPERASIEVHPRLHLGLISMHEGGSRKNGGIGFAIEEPTATVHLESDSTVSVADARPRPLSQDEIRAIEQAAAILRKLGRSQAVLESA